jgi:hypothetical protein
MRELAAGAQALASAVKAAQPQPQAPPAQRPSLRAPRRDTKSRNKRAAQASDPIQDEWGIYDASACGFEALYAKLEEQEQQSAAGSAAGGANGAVSRHQARASERGTVRHGPRPLAMWARRDDGASAAPPLWTPSPTLVTAQDETAALMRGLQLPHSIAAVRYAGGCRIQRVRVKSQPPPPKVPNTPIVIVSRRLLEEVRPHTSAVSTAARPTSRSKRTVAASR